MRLQTQFRGVDPAAPERLLADIQELAPGIIRRAAEIEAERRIPADIMHALQSIGVFRMFVPRSHGGLELDLPAGLDVIRALAMIDGSVGWTAMIVSGGSIMAPLLRRELYERVYRTGSNAIMVGSLRPSGTAEPTEGGWCVSGRWPFASACQQADWLFGVCVVTEDGKPVPGPAGDDGPPLMRGFCLPASEWQIEDTWYVAGLKGTGSHHISLKYADVPAMNVIDVTSGVPCVSSPLSHAVMQVLPLLHGASSVGMAEGALADLITLADTGRKQLHSPMAMRDSEVFQSELAKVAADIRAARAFLEVQAETHWRHALAGTLREDALLMQSRQAAIWIAATCVRAVDACFSLAGSIALYESSPLQRRLRDVHAAAQHGGAHPSLYVGVGRQLLGQSAAH